MGSAGLGVVGSDLTGSRCIDLQCPTGSYVAGPAGSVFPGSNGLNCGGCKIPNLLGTIGSSPVGSTGGVATDSTPL